MAKKSEELNVIVQNLLANSMDEMLNVNNANRTAIFYVDKKKFFVKVCNRRDYHQERRGYNLIKDLLPVTQLVTTVCNRHNGALVYEYEKSIGKNKGLLIDYFSQSDGDKGDIESILKTLYSVFQKTIEINKGLESQYLFKNRVRTRLTKYYNKQFCQKYTGQKITVNRTTINTDLTSIMREVKQYFKKKKSLPCVMSQGDVTDLNVGLKPLFFDYLTAGNNPLMAELASQTWFNILFSNYLAPKYNPLQYQEHLNIQKYLDQISQEKDNIVHKISKKRISFLNSYIREVILPIWKMCEPYDAWYDDFKNHFAVRVLGIFNLSKFDDLDQKVALFYLHKIYFLDRDRQINTPEQIMQYLCP